MASTLGDKIALYGTSGAHFGFGIQNNQFQIHTDTNAADVVFGYGTSAAMTETMRIKGNGKVGIGKSAPGSNLDVQGFTSYRGNPYTIASFAANATLAPLNITQGNSGLNPAISAGKNSDGNFDSLSFMTKDIERIKISVEGLVGIGTSTPTNLLQVLAPLSARTTTSAVTSANAVATIGAGDVALHFGNYDVTNAYGTWIQGKRTTDELSFGLALNPNGGNVGIGKSNPSVPLDVTGAVKASTTIEAGTTITAGGKSVPVSDEANLKIVRGTVTAAGGIVVGGGFSVVKVAGATGLYQITFTTAFSARPTITTSITGRYGVKAEVYDAGRTTFPANNTDGLYPGNGGFTVGILNSSAETAFNFGFSFIAIGPR
jgi:hypothetical protein